jgi:cell division protein FtsB
MARRKYKMTGCAKFFLILVILAPIAYVGASYFNGQDGIQNLKNLLGFSNAADVPASTDDQEGEVYQLNRDINRLQKDVDYYRRENERLKTELKDCQEKVSE